MNGYYFKSISHSGFILNAYLYEDLGFYEIWNPHLGTKVDYDTKMHLSFHEIGIESNCRKFCHYIWYQWNQYKATNKYDSLK